MKCKKRCLLKVLWAATKLPIRAFPQSATSRDETQDLRTLVEQLRTAMRRIAAEIDELKATKPGATPNTHYNTGGGGLNVPNMAPDLVFKGIFR
jgi:hypothetical protein